MRFWNVLAILYRWGNAYHFRQSYYVCMRCECLLKRFVRLGFFPCVLVALIHSFDNESRELFECYASAMNCGFECTHTRQLYSFFGYQIFYVSVKTDYNPRFFLLVCFFFNLIYNLFLANGFFRRIQYYYFFSTWKLRGFHFCYQKGFHNPNNNRIELHTNNTFKEFCIEGHIIYYLYKLIHLSFHFYAVNVCQYGIYNSKNDTNTFCHSLSLKLRHFVRRKLLPGTDMLHPNDAEQQKMEPNYIVTMCTWNSIRTLNLPSNCHFDVAIFFFLQSEIDS